MIRNFSRKYFCLGICTRLSLLVCLVALCCHSPRVLRPEFNDELSKAALGGDLRAVKLAYKKGADPNGSSAYRESALTLAASRRHTEIMRFLIENGADVHRTSYDGSSAFSHCCGAGNLEGLKLLTDQGVDLYAGNNACLAQASTFGHTAMIRYLLSKGMDVNGRGEYGHTPVMGAIALGHTEAVRTLIDAGADLRVKNKFGKTPLDIATEYKEYAIASMIRAELISPVAAPAASLVKPLSTRASSTVPPVRGHHFIAANVLDGSLNSCWQEGATGHGEGQWLEFTFSGPTVIRTLEIANGMQNPDPSFGGDLFSLNSRPRQVNICDQSQRCADFSLLDRKGYQSLELRWANVTRLRITIVSAYPGSKWPDAAISEVKFLR